MSVRPRTLNPQRDAIFDLALSRRSTADLGTPIVQSNDSTYIPNVADYMATAAVKSGYCRQRDPISAVPHRRPLHKRARSMIERISREGA